MFRRFGFKLTNKLIFLEGEQISSNQKDVLGRLEKMKFTTVYNVLPVNSNEISNFSKGLYQSIEKVYKNPTRDDLIFFNGSFLSILSYPQFKSCQKQLLEEQQKLKEKFNCEFISFPTDEYVMKLKIAHHMQQVQNPLIHLDDIPYILQSYENNSSWFNDTIINAYY